MNCLSTIAELTSPEFLSTISGPVAEVHIEPLTAIGFSASELQRVIVGEAGKMNSTSYGNSG